MEKHSSESSESPCYLTSDDHERAERSEHYPVHLLVLLLALRKPLSEEETYPIRLPPSHLSAGLSHLGQAGDRVIDGLW